MLRNYRIAAGEIEGTYYGRVFQDSDLAKWLEAVAYSLTVQPDADILFVVYLCSFRNQTFCQFARRTVVAR